MNDVDVVISNCREAGSLQRRAFTLIELLVVIAVIMILSGITLKIMGSVGNKAARARTIWKMEQVKNALAAYYAANGFYPPGDTYDANSFYSRDINFVGKNNEHPICSTDGIFFDTTVTNTYSSAADPFTSRGMPYYLYADPQVSKWKHYLSAVMPLNTFGKTNTTYSSGPTPPNSVQNSYVRFYDEWGRSYQYECSQSDNYQKYKLWSNGPLTNTTADDVGIGWQD
ncbi:MAG: type II secretion system protein [bacterium]